MEEEEEEEEEENTVIINRAGQSRRNVSYSVITDNSSPHIHETTNDQSESNASLISNYL